MRHIFVLIIVCALASPAFCGQDRVRLVTLEWEPYTGSHLPNNGFTAEIIQKAFKIQGLDSTLAFHPWQTAMDLARQGGVDAVFSAYYTKERAKDFFYSDPYAESMVLFFTLKGSAISFESLEDLKGYRIGITRGFANTAEFDAAPFLTKVTADTEKQSLENLIRGKVDLVVLDKFVGMSLINQFFPGFRDRIISLKTPLDKKPLYVLFPKKKASSPDVFLAFNQGLKQIRQTGMYDLILQRHQFLPIKAIDSATLNWPPYSGTSTKQHRLVSEIVTQAYKISGYDVQINIRPWARALRETRFGIHDLAFPAYYSDERNRDFVMVPLGIYSDVAFMKINPRLPDRYLILQDLTPYRIGIVHGYVNRPDFDEADFLTKLTFYSDKEAFDRLVKDGCDLIVIDKRVGALLSRDMKPPPSYTFMSPVLDSKMLYVAFSRKVPDLEKKIMAFKYGYAELEKNGRVKNILKLADMN